MNFRQYGGKPQLTPIRKVGALTEMWTGNSSNTGRPYK